VAVQPGVQPALYSSNAVQPDLYNPVFDGGIEHAADAADAVDAVGRLRGAAPEEPVEHPTQPVEHPAQPVEHLLNGAAEPPPRDRARTAAARHAARHGALPTVSELEALAEVSRGTAAAALRALREHPNPLHLVADTPDQETQS
jgi:hypothetical protein